MAKLQLGSSKEITFCLEVTTAWGTVLTDRSIGRLRTNAVLAQHGSQSLLPVSTIRDVSTVTKEPSKFVHIHVNTREATITGPFHCCYSACHGLLLCSQRGKFWISCVCRKENPGCYQWFGISIEDVTFIVSINKNKTKQNSLTWEISHHPFLSCVSLKSYFIFSTFY